VDVANAWASGRLLVYGSRITRITRIPNQPCCALIDECGGAFAQATYRDNATSYVWRGDISQLHDRCPGEDRHRLMSRIGTGSQEEWLFWWQFVSSTGPSLSLCCMYVLYFNECGLDIKAGGAQVTCVETCTLSLWISSRLTYQMNTEKSV